ncbi:MAG: hypothetical protein FJY91_00210 [Candidatus Harrisonbacteria bacterium]|nr:hypothetical protein [Candidatus Harrisonbacteria bacterium]
MRLLNLTLLPKSLLFFTILSSIFLLPKNSLATPSLFINWKALTLSSDSYSGKNLPTPGSQVELGIFALDGNQLTNLKTADVFWYQNENLIKKGSGLSHITLTLDESGTPTTIRVKVKKDDTIIEGLTIINPVSSNLYIEVKKTISKSSVFFARPLFFNVNNLENLSFEWEAGGKKVVGPSSLTLSVPPEIDSILLKSTVKNKTRKVEQVSETISLKNG